MDESTTVAQLKKMNWDFQEARGWLSFHKPKHLAMSIAIEAAELMEHFQWLDGSDSETYLLDPDNRHQVSDELADVLIYCLVFANVTDIDISEAIHAKMARNEGRFPLPQQ